MALIALDSEHSIVLAIDLQETLTRSIENGEQIVKRCEYLLRAATILNIPIISTTQNVARLGGFPERLADVLTDSIDKISFSAWKDPGVREEIARRNSKQILICGVETHICVALTALDLIQDGFDVAVCPDAVGSSTVERHKLGMERIRDAGVVPVHTESAVYEWMGSAKHERFREILDLTKQIR